MIKNKYLFLLSLIFICACELKNNYNSFFINKNNIEKDLIHLLNNFDLKNFRNKRLNCINTAKKFSTKNFVEEIEKLFI